VFGIKSILSWMTVVIGIIVKIPNRHAGLLKSLQESVLHKYRRMKKSSICSFSAVFSSFGWIKSKVPWNFKYCTSKFLWLLFVGFICRCYKIVVGIVFLGMGWNKMTLVGGRWFPLHFKSGGDLWNFCWTPAAFVHLIIRECQFVWQYFITR
jgi:hypothetical protein